MQHEREQAFNLDRLLADAVEIRSDWRVLVISWDDSALISSLGKRIDNVAHLLLSEQPTDEPPAFSEGGYFDVVICQEIARRLKDVPRLLRECSHALHPGGSLVLWDLLIAGPPKAVQYINALEAFRDPTHKWAYSLEDWETFITVLGLEICLSRTFATRLTANEWGEGYLVGQKDLLRAHILIHHAPPDAAQILEIYPVGLTCSFRRTFALLAAKKPLPRP